MRRTYIANGDRVAARAAAKIAQDAGIVAQGFYGCGCAGLRIGVRSGEFDCHMPLCDSWRPIAVAVQNSLKASGFDVDVVGLVDENRKWAIEDRRWGQAG